MELDDFKSAWNAEQPDSAALLAITVRATARRELDPLQRGIAIELAFNALAALLLGSYLGDHVDTPRRALPAALALVYAVVLVVACIRQLVLMRGLDRGGSVIETQRRLEQLNVERIRATIGTLLFAPLMWVPILIVAADAIFGFDAYRLGAGWLLANVAFGIAFAVAGLAAARAIATRWTAYPAFIDHLAGTSLRRARTSLRALRTFELEEA
jgi:uncharacterized membrane protein